MPNAPITRKGFFELRRGGPDGPLVSKHTSVVEAYSVAEDGDWIEPPEGWQVGVRAQFPGTISGDPVPIVVTPIQDSTVGFTAGSYSVDQNQGTVTLPVTRTGIGTAALQVSWSLADGTATDPTEYTDDSGLLNWNAAETGIKNIVVAIANFEETTTGDKNFTATLVIDSGLDEATILVATITIIDLGELLAEPLTFEDGTRQEAVEYPNNTSGSSLGGVEGVGNDPIVVTQATARQSITPRTGSSMLECYVNRGDPLPGEPAGSGGGDNKTSPSQFRTQNKFQPPNHPTLPGTKRGMRFEAETYAIGTSVYIPSDYPFTQRFDIVFQSLQRGANPTSTNRNPMVVIGGEPGVGDFWNIIGRALPVLHGDKNDHFTVFQEDGVMPIRLGWNDIVMNVRWNPLVGVGNEGFFQLWHRSSVDPWIKYVGYDGIIGANDGPDGPGGDWRDCHAQWDVGVYKGWHAANNDQIEPNTQERLLWVDDQRWALGVGKLTGPADKGFRLVAPVGLPFI